jgi:predicted peptidase
MNKFLTDPNMNYSLHIPDGYKRGTNKKWPLIVFLHGMAQRGKSLQHITSIGLPDKIKSIPDFPFFIITPQCPARTYWDRAKPALKVKTIIDTVINYYSIDKHRIYLTGFSMGGFGTWYIASEFPDTFAAIAPICGGGNPEMVKNIAHIPTWVFHGKKDRVVSVNKSYEMVAKLKTMNKAVVKFTIYPEEAHDCWDTVYSDTNLYDWFLKYSSTK